MVSILFWRSTHSLCICTTKNVLLWASAGSQSKTISCISCASLLLANGVPMKQIQKWLGHSDFSTTANVYAHLDYNSKLSSANAMVSGLQGALNAFA